MTLAAEGSLAPTADADRRGAAVEPRRSWASARPFVERTTEFNDDLATSGGWAATAGVARARALTIDVGCAAGATAGGVVPFLGWTTASAVAVIATVTVFCLLVGLNRGYDARLFGNGPTEYQAVLRSTAALSLGLMALAYLTRVDVPRSLLVSGALALAAVTLAGRFWHRRLLHRARQRGHAMMRTLVIGEEPEVTQVVRELGAGGGHGYQVLGACLPSADRLPVDLPVPVIGAVADVPQVVADRGVEVVVVAGAHLSGDGLRRLSWALDRAGAQLVVAPGLVDVAGPRLTVRSAAGLALMEVEVGASRRRRMGKCALDLVVGTAVLLMAAPVIGLAALAVRATSPGPAFYRQTRVGVDGRPFTMWKLRSMYVDSDARRDELLGSSDTDGVLFKMRADPRVTPVGSVLRRFSIDELPQLLNVVRGDMSLVGPRPPLQEEVADYDDPVHRRLRVRPGLTGLWQVSGRSDLSWEQSVRLDLRYVDNWSLVMDLMILWRTGRAVLGGNGAY
ncbi:sugar transferase [Cellulomonas bogoriensis]|uniref:Polyprenyl glycosylphosphotransferase n=1 Tax=Cellulomonas bogoriensis 69B4 = DSM 16987 TaxID=1386082 RepID=A0A0A0C185_9CELL|nr:sugar transferase [Cellulomonas bogoriensis]KGM13950.1 polyprenyl glycosylphosphotransferase [Cellulomonas bogoriensis 69B4 = DSM 16987]